MNIEYIEDFIAVAETKSINKASLLRNISTPALSKRIKQVENYFNCDLFYRTSKGIYLTNSGEIVLEKLINIQQSLQELKKTTASIQISKISLGTLPSFSLYKLPNIKEQTAFNQLDIKIENNTQILLNHLNNGELDIIIGDISSTNNRQLNYKTLYCEDYLIVFPTNHPLNSKVNIDISDLLEYRIFLLEPPCDTLAFVRNEFSTLHLNIELKQNLESILASVKTNQGITIIPQSLATRLESMNLNSKKLSQHHRKIGLIAYNQNTISNLQTLLSESLQS
ncbi:LysR family transcriptional regulator [Mammaliicoccus sp. Dog046]|uniref:LysR family transcriptional regulator n=1 Tax=Mammaliicoccus sp. Dog046 TaxID=3034233 RepID=UPI002B25FD50|nr:LysR family transcriptional regulator [Mammaliicoccus sp. Dog046]WQK85254.1 LysR family transcriptional regulator [Mammaliicoccus sp. Dog046]